MKKQPGHTRLILVCFISISLFFVLETTCVAGQSSMTKDPLRELEEYHQNFIHHVHQSELSLAHPQISENSILSPRTSPQINGLPSNFIQQSPPEKETITMNTSSSKKQIQDMFSMNRDIKRDIFFDDFQTGNSIKKDLKNSMDIEIYGDGQKPVGDGMGTDGEDVNGALENIGGNYMVSKQHDGPVNYWNQTGSQDQRPGNYINIAVSGVDVRAINTADGGNAVATSNIIIEPVQIINCAPEVEEKL